MTRIFKTPAPYLTGMIIVIVGMTMIAGCSARQHKEEVVMTYKELGENISEIHVTNLDGEEIPMASLWEDRRIVLTFFRHFG